MTTPATAKVIAVEDLDLVPVDLLLDALARRTEHSLVVYRHPAKQPGYMIRRAYWRGGDHEVLMGLCMYAYGRIYHAMEAMPVDDSVVEGEEL